MTPLLLQARISGGVFLRSRAGDLGDVRWASLLLCNSIPDRAQLEVDPSEDRQPVQLHRGWRDVVSNVQLVDETCVQYNSVSDMCCSGSCVDCV